MALLNQNVFLLYDKYYTKPSCFISSVRLLLEDVSAQPLYQPVLAACPKPPVTVTHFIAA